MNDHPPVGPRRITSQAQVSLPAEVMADVNLQKGADVYWQVQDDPPGTVLLIPADMVQEWIRRGRGKLSG